MHRRRQTAAPSRPQTNGVAERTVRTVFNGTRAVLNAVGYAPKWWNRAVRYFCVADNAAKRGPDGKTPWERRYFVPFPAKLIPFGALVDYYPPA